ncbi:MAG: MT-A70 family methyltransferase [Muribaculaceae bacterium]|nr:MT-A70 family methyltransferase [Muribaculaceae bacterium]
MGRSADRHYPTMSLDEIVALPVAEISADDCVLFLWTTMPFLRESFAVLKAWGFEYKTVAFVWVKQNKKANTLFWGMGHWTRSNVELCLLATKGHPKRQSTSVHQVVISHIEEHSKKPDEVRDRITLMMGTVPRVELFARTKTEGWDVWGNEVPCDIDLNGSPDEAGGGLCV